MAITSTQNNADTSERFAQGGHLDNAGTPAALTVTLGFTPKYVRVVNLTDRIEFEFFYGMTNTHALKTIANGTRTLETSGGITVGSNSFTLAAAAVLQNKQYYWIAS